jgi:phosphate uptake regulator
MDELRKIQQVGYSTLTVSIPKGLADELGLKQGDGVLIRGEADGTIRLIPASKSRKESYAVIRAEYVGSNELLSKLLVGCYALGYDRIEVLSKGRLDGAKVTTVTETIRRLRGMEMVEVSDNRMVAQSFMDPTKFPVDSLIKRLQILVSKSLDDVIEAVDLRRTGTLNEVRRIQDEVDELYWLVVRQLLVALNRREMAAEVGIESPLHASGDRVSAKTLDEIGRIILDVAEELVRLRGKGTKMDARVTAGLVKLASKARSAFNATVESLLAPDIRMIEKSISLVDETFEIEMEVTRDLLESGEYGYSRVLVSHFGQLARYCNIMIEIASHRLLRKTSRVAVVQSQ